MENNHLTYFKVENFKKFESLEVNDIGQFNLIVGDNNVGKTCLLEALLFDENPNQMISNFYVSLTKRGFKFEIKEITTKIGNTQTIEKIIPKENYFKKNIIKESTDGLHFRAKVKSEITISINTLPIDTTNEFYAFITKTHISTKFSKEDIEIKKNINQFINIRIEESKKSLPLINDIHWIYDYDLDILNFPLITFNDSTLDKKTVELYNNLDIYGEEALLNTLKIINPELFKIGFKNEFEDLKDVFVLSFNGEKKQIPLNFLGDGFKRIFYIILKTISLKGKRIMIDEIEIGIHYSKMKDFWVNIFKVCKELDVQLFATTHSEECIEAYVEAAKEVNEQNIRLIRLQENKDKSIKAICYPYNAFEDIAESKTENR